LSPQPLLEVIKIGLGIGLINKVMELMNYALSNKDKIRVHDYSVDVEGEVVTLVIVAKDAESAKHIKAVIDELANIIKEELGQ